MIKNTGKEKILIVDDVETNRAILEEIIKDMGEIPILAESGEQALEMIKEIQPQLVLTDISMPGMDGYELCRILKEDRETKNIPIIFISAFDDPKDIIEGFSLGGEDYITKPFISNVVQARVGVHLRLHEVKRELMEMNRRLQVSVSEQLKQMEQEKRNIVYAMANIAAQNSNYQQEHMARLGENCRILAQGMQLSPIYEDKISDTYIDTIELAAPLCDIGNIGISKEILQKKTGLSEEETATIQSHTKIGAKLLEDIHVNSDYNDFISIAIDIARHHHENWDGSGYPDRLKGEQIPLAAQIVSVMERYCILTGEEACSREDALDIMKSDSGVCYNPDVFDICCKISRQLC
ncbi:MAG: response regulator [Bacteroidales bacterium]|nr:response regulator [Clostridium sp.]MCM1203200.1 response regulator [Bacteroidales bacterium]